ncbi:Zn-dependent alcohol dehydrogenase [Limobrevibacterium gyesilva]|uniref:Zn-dependent alcohol dehydrogenase n=1 Tax=Limobrevibacterium gyesilva TaxID=2991712 RepID=A0AA42CFR3_9PROT|nr:Zn-dependent alcohol dehydrogenase [Limobrevibacterium gyesilva]MCW3473045.1 Zn-dependent alcohol dehydrogenase [Limobrevibacterium gyesilva]
MKAAVLHAAHQPLTIEDIGLARPKRNEVLVRTAFAGLCHSDLHFMEGLYPYPVPCVLGHESAGVVEAVGEDVTYVQPGDHVVTCLSVFCGACPQCVTGHPNLCENTEVKLMPGMSRRLTWKGEVLHQFMNLSSFAEQMLVHEHAIVKIDPDIPLDRAALVGCGVVTGVMAVFNAARVEPGSTVAVIGCGGIGLSAVNGAALAGAERIIAIDTQPAKLELAREMGATDLVNASNADPVDIVRDLTGGGGVHYAFEAIGSKETAEQSFRMLRPGGLATIIGMIPVGTKIELHGADFLRDRRIQGTSMGGNRFRVDMPRLLNLWRQGRLKLDYLISGRIRLDQINEGFAMLKSGATVRQLIDFA